MEKQYLVIRRYATRASKPHVFDTLEDALKCAEKLDKTGKTKAQIFYGFVDGYCISNFEIIKW